ncbi:hypothetical protein L7F22_026452 [Adiantum nelumboides]|nr:hypothetical protein [Adiantum nelumboides]
MPRKTRSHGPLSPVSSLEGGRHWHRRSLSSGFVPAVVITTESAIQADLFADEINTASQSGIPSASDISPPVSPRDSHPIPSLPHLFHTIVGSGPVLNTTGILSSSSIGSTFSVSVGPLPSSGFPFVPAPGLPNLGLALLAVPGLSSAALTSGSGPVYVTAPVSSGLPGVTSRTPAPLPWVPSVPIVVGTPTMASRNQGFKYSKFLGKSEEDPDSHVRSFEKRYALLDGSPEQMHKEAVFESTLHFKAARWLAKYPMDYFRTYVDIVAAFLKRCRVDKTALQMLNRLRRLKQKNHDVETYTAKFRMLLQRLGTVPVGQMRS